MDNFDKPTIRRQPRLNLAIGPNCPVRCEGCYNHFGNTSLSGELVTKDEIVDFASEVRNRDIDGVTLSGGDPLFHPEIEDILAGLKGLEYRTKLDTVGTGFLEDARILFKGRGSSTKVDIERIKDTLESVTIPLDGVDSKTITGFRRGRPNIFNETSIISNILKEAGVKFGFNTVVNAKNLHQINEIGKLALDLGAFEWHVFEYDMSGPNPSSQKSKLAISYDQFMSATESLEQASFDGMRLDLRTKESRIGTGAYFFVNDAGEAWSPTGEENIAIRYGHITRDRERVMEAYDRYLEDFNIKFLTE